MVESIAENLFEMDADERAEAKRELLDFVNGLDAFFAGIDAGAAEDAADATDVDDKA